MSLPMYVGFNLIGIGEIKGITGDTRFSQSDSSSDSSSINLKPGNRCMNSGMTHSGEDELTIVSGESTSRFIDNEFSFLSSAKSSILLVSFTNTKVNYNRDQRKNRLGSKLIINICPFVSLQ